MVQARCEKWSRVRYAVPFMQSSSSRPVDKILLDIFFWKLKHLWTSGCAVVKWNNSNLYNLIFRKVLRSLTNNSLVYSWNGMVDFPPHRPINICLDCLGFSVWFRKMTADDESSQFCFSLYFKTLCFPHDYNKWLTSIKLIAIMTCGCFCIQTVPWLPLRYNMLVESCRRLTETSSE